MRRHDPRPWQERELELVDKLYRRLWLTHPYTHPARYAVVERARRLWRFWHRDASRWVVFGKGKLCFGPTSRREAEKEANRRYGADLKARPGRLPAPYYLQEVFG